MQLNRIALLIGIDEYESDYWSPLPYVRGDISGNNGLYDILSSRLGESYNFDNITIVDPKTKNSDLKEKIWEVCCSDTRYDLIFLYFTGHGTLHPKFNTPCIVTYETNSKDPEASGITFDWISTVLTNTTSPIIVVIDACFSGQIEKVFKSKIFPEGKRAIFASSSANEESFSSKDGSQSHFTQKFIKGLCGYESTQKNGLVTTISLNEYLKKEFDGDIQEPVCIVPDIKSDIVLSLPTTPIKAEIDLESIDVDNYINDYLIKKITILKSKPLFSKDDFFVEQQILAYRIMKSNSDNFQKVRATEYSDTEYGVAPLIQWIHSDNKIAIVQGDTGIGKSTILNELLIKIVELKNSAEVTLIPIFVDLRIFADIRLHGRSARKSFSCEEEATRKFRAIFIDYLQNECGLPLLWNNFIDFCDNHDVVLLLDGLDEMSQEGKYSSVVTHLKLIKEILRNKSKIIISTRTHYIQSDNLFFKLLNESKIPWKNSILFDLLPFESYQIDRYFEKRLNRENVKKWKELKSKSISLPELNKRPFLLGTLLKMLDQNIDKDQQITESDIFLEYMKEWLARDKWRFEQFFEDFSQTIQRDLLSLHDAELVPKVNPNIDINKWSEELLTRFIEVLALELKINNTDYIFSYDIADFLRNKVPSLPDIFLSFFEYAIRTCTFLSRDPEGRYKFLDDSLQSFFAASSIYREIKRTQYSWDTGLYTRSSITPIPHSLGKCPLHDEVKRFLLNMITPGDKPILLDIIKDEQQRIRYNPNTLHYLGGNCLTLLAWLNKDGLKGDFNNLILSGADLSTRDLSGINFEFSYFHKANFYRTSFNGASLDGAQFYKCNFDQAVMSDVIINGNSVISSCSGIESIVDKPEEFSSAVKLSAKGVRKLKKPSINNDLTKMHILPGGRFKMGADIDQANYEIEKPAHTVVVSSFAIDVHPVTNRQFQKFLKYNPEWGKNAVIQRLKNAYYLKEWDDYNKAPQDKLDHPVTYVCWYAANAYAEWAGKRLPTEAEWEFALRDGRHEENLVYPWGNSLSKPEMPEAYWSFIQKREIVSVKAKNIPRSANYGLIFMNGNVNEWVWDWYNENYFKKLKDDKESDSCINPKGPNFGYQRVFRGGSFLSGEDPKLRNFTCFFRDFLIPQNTNQDMGFRCVMSPEQCNQNGLCEE